jgi:hypothetical protein
MKQKNINADAAEFWKEYETTHGEEVLAFSLGLYLRGCASIENSMWGLLIATDGGFRFHHFAQESWISALSRLTAGGSGKGPKEVSIFIPKEKIISVEYRVELNWFKRIFTASQPLFVLRYYNDDGREYEFTAETDKGSFDVVEALKEMVKK